MSEKKILIIEDSSKSTFGGGQKITLMVMKILCPTFSLILADCEQTTRFQHEAKAYTHRKIAIKCYGKIVGSNSAFAIGFKEIITFPLFALYNFFLLARQVKKIQDELQYVYATTNKTLIYAYFLHLLYNIPYIYHAHSIDKQTSLWQRIIRPAYKKAYAIICVSNFVKNGLGVGNRITIYNSTPFLNQENKTKQLHTGQKIIVASFSTLVAWKGIEYFIKSHPLLSTKKQVNYYVYGNGAQQHELQKNKSPNVIFKGFVEDVVTAMQNVDVVVIPSIAPESCPLIALEAMAMGIPMVVTDIGGQAEIIPNNIVGLQVPIKNSAELAVAIDRLIEDSLLYKKLSIGCKKEAEKFDFEIFESKIRKLFV